MRRICVIFIFVFLPGTFIPTHGQTVNKEKEVPARIKLLSNEYLKGVIISVGDSSLQFMEKKTKLVKLISYRAIERIQIRKGAHAFIGFLAGAAAGIAIDVILVSSGLGADDEIPVGPVLIMLSVPIVTMIVGSRVGVKVSKSAIDGRYENFVRFKRRALKIGLKQD